METPNPRKGGVMPAPKKYPDEMRDRAIRLVADIAEDAGSITAACRRIGEQLGINSDTLRGWVKQAQVDAGQRPLMRRGSGSWNGRTPSCAGPMRYCAPRVLFLRQSSTATSPR